MSSFLSQLRLDARIAWRGKFLHVTLGMALVFALLLRFALPVELAHGASELLGDGGAPTLATGGSASHTVELLGPTRPPPPFNGSWLPLIFGLDTVILGFFFAGVMILQEKQHGTVRFYRVSPGGTLRYVASKVVVLTAMALCGAALLTAIVAPHGLFEVRLYALLGLATAALTLVGMGIAVFYSNLSSFFYPMALAGMVLSVPMVAYGLPSTTLPGVELIPTWGVMFGTRELLYPAGREAVVTTSLQWLSVVFVAFLVGGTALVDRVLMKERA